MAWATPVFANPRGAHVAHGQVGFSRPNTSTLEITNSPNAIINWNNFSIGKGETTRFIQQRSTSQVLNRVVTQKPSSILGNLISNGRVFLINPNGMVFGPKSVVDTAGFVGSTLNMTDKDFLAGKFAIGIFAGSIRNHGVIEAKSVGRDKKGNIILSASKDVVLEKDSVTKATAGKDGGKVRIEAGDKLRIVKEATVRADRESGGEIEIDAGRIETAGSLSAKGSIGRGGEVVVTSNTTISEAETARIDVSGSTGGRISNLSDEGLRTSATYSAVGTDGKGGRIELSAHEVELPKCGLRVAPGSLPGDTFRSWTGHL